MNLINSRFSEGLRDVPTSCRYLLRSQREWTDRGAFYRIYPRPSQGDASGGDQLARLLGYIGLLYPDYASAKNMASTSSAVATASADGGVALQETSWMVRGLHRLHSIYIEVQTTHLIQSRTLVTSWIVYWSNCCYTLLLFSNN